MERRVLIQQEVPFLCRSLPDGVLRCLDTQQEWTPRSCRLGEAEPGVGRSWPSSAEGKRVCFPSPSLRVSRYARSQPLSLAEC